MEDFLKYFKKKLEEPKEMYNLQFNRLELEELIIHINTLQQTTIKLVERFNKEKNRTKKRIKKLEEENIYWRSMYLIALANKKEGGE